MRRAGALLALCFLAACGKDPFGSPPRAGTHGFRAHATVKQGGAATDYEIAVRADDRRREPPLGKPGPVLIWLGKEKKVLELDPATRSYKERPLSATEEVLPGHPLAPGFSEKTEADRRGIQSYHRESDTVFAGHVCWIWRFDDKPDDPQSPSTSYWVAPDLDRLVLRVVREVPRPQGIEVVSSSDLTNVRPGADPTLFTPQDFKKVK